MNQLVHLNYTAPVTVVVNIDLGTVEQVVVGDEYLSPVIDATYDDGVEPVSDQDHLLATTIADGDGEWPAWTFGW